MMLREMLNKPHHLSMWPIWFELSRYNSVHTSGCSQYRLMFTNKKNLQLKY